MEAEVRAGIQDDAELAEQVRQQSESLDATKKVILIPFITIGIGCVMAQLDFQWFIIRTGLKSVPQVAIILRQV